MFGQIAPGITTTCGANQLYPTYTYFYVEFWPTITILSVTIIPASCILGFILAITINVKNSRNRIIAIQQINTNQHGKTTLKLSSSTNVNTGCPKSPFTKGFSHNFIIDWTCLTNFFCMIGGCIEFLFLYEQTLEVLFKTITFDENTKI